MNDKLFTLLKIGLLLGILYPQSDYSKQFNLEKMQFSSEIPGAYMSVDHYAGSNDTLSPLNYFLQMALWVAANSHALYNRYDSVYRATIHVFGIEAEDYRDNVDYNPLNYDLYYEYDRLEKMGELYSMDSFHNNTYNPHYYILSGKPWLAFIGRVGGYWEEPLKASTLSPYMPPFRSSVQWIGFTINYNGFGNVEPFFWGDIDVFNISYVSDLSAGD